jgi:hypothetical protein
MLTAIFVKEEDISTYTKKAADNPKTLNKILYLRPPANILSFNEIVLVGEKDWQDPQEDLCSRGSTS